MQTNDEAPFTDGELLDIIAGELGVGAGEGFDRRLLSAVKRLTCVNVHEGREFECTACDTQWHLLCCKDCLGEWEHVRTPNFCPNCGARVIREGGCE